MMTVHNCEYTVCAIEIIHYDNLIKIFGVIKINR
jgi:hypothetical protein